METVAERLRGSSLVLGGQDCHDQEKGAFTGSISASMLKDVGARAVLVGHSERRHGLGESDELISRKAKSALDADLDVVLCIGETEAEYLSGKRIERLSIQLEASIAETLPAERIVVAYEPVWAIGTGRTASPDDIFEAHAFIRGKLEELMPNGIDVAILYGGSVKPDNAGEIMALEHVDGVLVGGASLKADDFCAISEACLSA